MAIKIEKENLASRTPGNPIESGSYLIYKGTVIVMEKNITTGAIEVRPYTDTDVTNLLIPSGLAIDQNVQNPLQAQNGLTVGDGYDYTDFNRGGLVAAIDDATVWVKGDTLVKPDDTWTISTKVYWDGAAALFTDTTSGKTVAVGALEDKILSGVNVTEIRIKLVKFA